MNLPGKGMRQDWLAAINAEHPFGQVHLPATGAGLGRVFDGDAVHDDFPILNFFDQLG